MPREKLDWIKGKSFVHEGITYIGIRYINIAPDKSNDVLIEAVAVSAIYPRPVVIIPVERATVAKSV